MKKLLDIVIHSIIVILFIIALPFTVVSVALLSLIDYLHGIDIENDEKAVTGQYLVDNPEFTKKILGEELWKKWCNLVKSMKEEDEKTFKAFLKSEFDLDKLKASLTLWNLYELPENVSLEELGYGDIFEEDDEDEA